MTLPRTVAEVLTDHVVFEVECIDRMYCNVYVPQLQHTGGLLGYVQRQLGLPIASTAPLGKITDAFAAAMRRFARDQHIPWVQFAKGQRKDDVMHEYLAGFTAEEGVLFIGRAQEKTSLFRTERRRDAHGESYPWIVKTTGVVNQFYVYAVDADFGPFFLKFCSYFPYNAKLCLNGHEWAKRQATQAGIGHTALDNGFATITDPADLPRLQAICDRLGPEQIDALLRKWLALLPHPFSPADREAAGQMSYDLRRLRVHGLIIRIPHSHRYRLTETGLHHAMLLSHVHTRLLLPGLAQLTDPDPPAPSPLRAAARNYRHALDQLTEDAGLAA